MGKNGKRVFRAVESEPEWSFGAGVLVSLTAGAGGGAGVSIGYADLFSNIESIN